MRKKSQTAKPWYLEFVDQGDEDTYKPRTPKPQSEIITEDSLPDLLVVPAFPFDGDGFTRLELQVCRSNDHELALGFTSRQVLVDRLGPYQPWVAASGKQLLKLVSERRIDGLLIDPAEDVVSAIWTAKTLVALREINDVRL